MTASGTGPRHGGPWVNALQSPKVAGLALAMGIGAALAAGSAAAHADSGADGVESPSRSASSDPGPAAPSRTGSTPARERRAGGDDAADAPAGTPQRAALRIERLERTAELDTGPAGAGRSPRPPQAPPPVAEAMLVAARREAPTAAASDARPVRATAAGPSAGSSVVDPDVTRAPSPRDAVATPYGALGTWSLQPSGQISDWLGQKYWDRTLLEPVNIVVVDRASTTPEESTRRLNEDLSAAGFPARRVHSTGYRGLIDGVLYDQQPSGAEEAFSNDYYLLPNDHARFFGPAPAPDGVGYIWTATLSREEVGLYNWSPTHTYVSFAQARNTLRDNLIGRGATDLGMIFLGNYVNNATQTSGDHDGWAAVVELRRSGVTGA